MRPPTTSPSSEARFGTANQRFTLDGSDPRELDAAVAAVRAWFGTVETIGHRQAPVPGSVEPLDLRAQDPHGPYGGPMLALLEGRWPGAAGEVALTDAAAAAFRVGVGDALALDGRDLTVVGLVENPGDLGDEFALVPPSGDAPPQSVTILAHASRERAGALPAGVDARWKSRPACHATLICLTAGQSEQATATGGALALLGVLLGTGGAYPALAAGYDDDLASLGRVPLPHLTVILVGLPLAAAAAGGWVLAGRAPVALARQPLE